MTAGFNPESRAGYDEGYADAETGRGLIEQGTHSDAWWSGYLTGQQEHAMDHAL